MTLYILVEGNDDARFFERIFAPILRGRHGGVKLWTYRCEKSERITNFIRSIQSMKEAYIFVCDIDQSPCVTDKKHKIATEWSARIPDESVVVVIKEIESWYLAGASSKLMTVPYATDTLTKEQFAKLVPPGMPRAQFMQEILGHFNFEMARRKNRSFQYFVRRWVD